MSVYIQSIKQISFQKPLCEQWLEQAVFVNANYNEAKDPDFKPYFSPIEARRMGKTCYSHFFGGNKRSRT